MTVKLSEIIYDVEFDYIINQNNQLQLVDMLRANLGNIEEDTFELTSDLALAVIDRLENYLYDYTISDIEDALLHKCQETSLHLNSNWEELIPFMQKYPDKFQGLIEYVEAICNPERIDISDILEESKKCKIQ